MATFTVAIREFHGGTKNVAIPGSKVSTYTELKSLAYRLFAKKGTAQDVHFHLDNAGCDGSVDDGLWDGGFYTEVQGLNYSKLQVWAHFEKHEVNIKQEEGPVEVIELSDDDNDATIPQSALHGESEHIQKDLPDETARSKPVTAPQTSSRPEDNLKRKKTFIRMEPRATDVVEPLNTENKPHQELTVKPLNSHTTPSNNSQNNEYMQSLLNMPEESETNAADEASVVSISKKRKRTPQYDKIPPKIRNMAMFNLSTHPPLPAEATAEKLALEFFQLERDGPPMGAQFHHPHFTILSTTAKQSRTHAQLISGIFGMNAPIPCSSCDAKGRLCRIYHPIVRSWKIPGLNMGYGSRCGWCRAFPGPRCELRQAEQAAARGGNVFESRVYL